MCRPHHRVYLTKAARLDLRAWQFFLSHFNCRSMMDGRRWHRDPGILMETDASGNVSFGAICDSAWIAGRWPAALQQADIMVKELAAVVVAVETWSTKLAHHCVLVRCDNSAVVACINAHTSQSSEMMVWLRHLFIVVMLSSILVRAIHTPGRYNSAADALSRGLVQVFHRIRPDADRSPSTCRWPAFVTRRRCAR